MATNNVTDDLCETFVSSTRISTPCSSEDTNKDEARAGGKRIKEEAIDGALEPNAILNSQKRDDSKFPQKHFFVHVDIKRKTASQAAQQVCTEALENMKRKIEEKIVPHENKDKVKSAIEEFTKKVKLTVNVEINSAVGKAINGYMKGIGHDPRRTENDEDANEAEDEDKTSNTYYELWKVDGAESPEDFDSGFKKLVASIEVPSNVVVRSYRMGPNDIGHPNSYETDTIEERNIHWRNRVIEKVEKKMTGKSDVNSMLPDDFWN